MPRSVFLGWSDDDRGWALALLAEEADECSGCGQPRSESYSEESEGRYTARVQVCQACLVAEHVATDAQGRGAKVEIIRKGVGRER